MKITRNGDRIVLDMAAASAWGFARLLQEAGEAIADGRIQGAPGKGRHVESAAEAARKVGELIEEKLKPHECRKVASKARLTRRNRHPLVDEMFSTGGRS